MRFIKQIKNIFVQKNKERKEQELREEELVKIVENLRNIDLFGKNKKVVKNEIIDETFSVEKQDLVKKVENLRNVKIFDKNINNVQISSKKIDVISKINIDRMSNTQLQGTYKCVKKSIEDAKQKGKTEELKELIELKNKIKNKLINENDSLNIQSIKCNLMLGNVEKIDIYENTLIKFYNELENNNFNGYDNDIQQMKIHILSLLKLINKIKKSNKTHIKKIA